MKDSFDALADSISKDDEAARRPNHWLHPVDAEQRNVDLLPEPFWPDAEKGCVHCKGAFVEIAQFGVKAPPLTASCVSYGGPLLVWATDPVSVVAVRLLCSLGHTTVVERTAWSNWALPAMLGMGVLGFYLLYGGKKATARRR